MGKCINFFSFFMPLQAKKGIIRLNEMILRQKHIMVKEIESAQFHPLKTEHQLAEYIMEYNKSLQSK